MNNRYKLILYFTAAIPLFLLSAYLGGSLYYPLAAAVAALFLYAYNSISAMDTIPDSDYLVTGEGPFAAAGIYVSLILASSISQASGAAVLFCAGYLLFFKHIINPHRKEALYTGLLLSAALWIPLAVYFPDKERAVLPLTGFAAAGMLDNTQLIFSAAVSVLIIFFTSFFKEEFRIIKHGNEDQLLSGGKKVILKTSASLIRPFSAAGTVISAGLMLSFGYFIRKIRPADTGLMIFLLFFCLTQIFFIAAAVIKDLMYFSIFIIILSIIAYFAADRQWKFFNKRG